MQGYHSSLPVFQTQHIGIVLKVSVDNPRYKKQPASGWPWTLLSALHIGQGWLVASNSGWIPLNKVSGSHWMYFHTSSSASPSKFSGLGVFHVAPITCHQYFYIDAGATSQNRATTDHMSAFSFEHWNGVAVPRSRSAVDHLRPKVFDGPCASLTLMLKMPSAQTYMTKPCARACVGAGCPPCHLQYAV